MRQMGRMAGLVAAVLLACGMGAAAQLEEDIAYLHAYEFGESRLPLTRITDHARATDADGRAALEAELLPVLGSDASLEAQRFTARLLAEVGTPEAVPALAALVPDPATNDFAVKALETMPFQEAGAALREAAGKVSGLDQVAVIQALARRGEPEALGVLGRLVHNDDIQVATAAVIAVGEIGGERALMLLQQTVERGPLEIRPALYLAFVTLAEGMPADDRTGAASIFEYLFRDRGVPAHARSTGLVNLVRARPQEALRLAEEGLEDSEPEVVRAAVGILRELEAPEATQVLLARLPEADPEMQVVLLNALGARGDAAAREAVMAAAQQEQPELRLAAVAALGSVGDAEAAPQLVTLATSDDAHARRVARAALRTLPGEEVNAALIEMGRTQDGPAGVEAIRVLLDRNAADVCDELLSLAREDTGERQQEALRALQVLGAQEQVPQLLAMLDTAEGESRREVERAALAILQRSPDAEAAVEPVVQAFEAAGTPETQATILNVLAALPNARTLEALRGALDSDAPPVRAAAVDGLANWPNQESLDDVRQIAESPQSSEEKARALAGYVRIVRAAELEPLERLDHYAHALELADTAAQKRGILSGLAEVAHPEALDLAAAYQDDEELRADANVTVLRVAQAISGAYTEEALAAIRPFLDGPEGPQHAQAHAINHAIHHFDGHIVAWEVAGPYYEEGLLGAELFEREYLPQADPEAADWRLFPMASPPDQPYVLALGQVLGGYERVGFLRTEVYSPTSQDAVLELGSTDAVRVWVNGEEVHARNSGRHLVVGEDRIEVRLNEGWNVLMLGLYQYSSDWAATARLRSPDGEPLEGLEYELPGMEDFGWTPMEGGSLSGQQVL